MPRIKADLILTHGYVITMDPERRIIKDGAVAVICGRIFGVGDTEEILRAFDGPQYDAKGGVVHPGLIDAHEHVGQHLTRGFEPDTFSVYDTWTKFECYEFPNIDAAFERAGVRLAMLEMAKNGTTCFADTGSLFYMDASIDALNECGIRGIVGAIGGDMFQPELSFLSAPTDALLFRMEENLRKFGKKSRRRVYAGCELCGMGDCSDALVLGAKEIAEAHAETLYMHQAVYRSEFDQYMARYGASPVRHLYDIGVLDPRTALVHMIHLTDEDVRIMAETGASAVHCPAASLKFALGASSIGKFPEMNAAGVPIALGTDSGTWADALDVFQLMYLAATIHREARREMLPLNAFRAFEMATIEGARVLGLDHEIGSLEIGKEADIVIHAADLPECHSPFDPLTSLVYAARSKSVKDVLVHGEWIVKDRKAVRVDEEKIFAETDREAKRFAQKSGYRIHSPWPVSG
ncbi:MAG: amidohydrolase family protein [Lachnospiraceae bacterium]|nr:amidohydrolase family protein [Lachnospiraceae bacterium]